MRALNSDAKTIINRGEVLIMGQEITQYRKYQEAKMGKMPDDVTREEMEEHVCEWYAYGREGSMSPVRDAEVLDAILRTIRKSRIVDSDAAPQAAPPEGETTSVPVICFRCGGATQHYAMMPYGTAEDGEIVCHKCLQKQAAPPEDLSSTLKAVIAQTSMAGSDAPPEGAEDGDEFRRLAGEIFTGVFNEGMCEFDIADKIKALLQKQGSSVTREDIGVIVQSLQDFKGHEAGMKYLANKLTEAGVEVKDA